MLHTCVCSISCIVACVMNSPVAGTWFCMLLRWKVTQRRQQRSKKPPILPEQHETHAGLIGNSAGRWNKQRGVSRHRFMVLHAPLSPLQQEFCYFTFHPNFSLANICVTRTPYTVQLVPLMSDCFSLSPLICLTFKFGLLLLLQLLSQERNCHL